MHREGRSRPNSSQIQETLLYTWTRKFKQLLESSLGWEFQLGSAVDGIYFEENDEYAPVVEMLDDEALVG
ncbi:A1 cistron-splicing factor AAR2 [Vigna unguiculata]|uniref:A1 cistron-splicing factor AAR2 n=1 Tax=Vigna unguiculata TaxID=3917 RepID=A0A4D6NDT4_VIGUN|nr:A1 cistron-splicing factor AAR2 [Vigna unguiculata]